MGRSKEQRAAAEERARRSLEAAQRSEAFKAMQQAEAEEIEAKTMRLRALRTAMESSKPNPSPSGPA